MRIGIIGFPQSGKTTVFEILTQKFFRSKSRQKDRLVVSSVLDKRLDILSDIFCVKKIIYAQIEYFLPGQRGCNEADGLIKKSLEKVKSCDVLIHVVKNFGKDINDTMFDKDDLVLMDEEMMFSDFLIIENKLKRVYIEQKKGIKKHNLEELKLLMECKRHVENNEPLRKFSEIIESKLIKNYSFLSIKPLLVLFNNDDMDVSVPKSVENFFNCMTIRGKLEWELIQIDIENVFEFCEEFGVKSFTVEKIVPMIYELMGLVSFFTIKSNEVRAWILKANTFAVDAAKVIHSDIKKGFICAEVFSFVDLVDVGSVSKLRKMGKVRLEGKAYIIHDGDVINFRFNL